MNLFFGIFNFFTINLPHWVYVQYLTLYINWMNWWNNAVNIKSLNNIFLFENPLNENNSFTDENDPKESNYKKKIIIALGVITLIGIGVLIYLYSDFSGSNGDNIPNPTRKIRNVYRRRFQQI